MTSTPPLARQPPRPPRHHLLGARLRDDRGSTAVEIALAVPIGIALLVLLIAAGRYSTALIEVQSTASAAARAASLARSPGAATTAAAQSTATMTDCATRTVRVDTTAFRPGGQVTVEVTCTISTRTLTGFGAPGALTVTATSTSPLDVYRTTELP
ncbi:TadE/TadG family type IV pilus assembly protein [Paractinoplanes toevensis]|uniref:TadE-like protein n=1 Tax=Paractinoplanes toevensis TaxID=571911 RepID=A0A919WDR9_9ACTN|nr:TadE family protein [Actinoplanes toevensis]GIM98243.1 hypothetical protein Ato02nite_100360 [Actinoplanes toevensis]